VLQPATEVAQTQLVGRTRGDQIVVFDGDSSLKGKLIDVKVTDAKNLTLFAKAAQDEISIHAALDQLDGNAFVEFLIDAPAIESWTRRLGGSLIDPIKTTLVHEQRSMTTWVARK